MRWTAFPALIVLALIALQAPLSDGMPMDRVEHIDRMVKAAVAFRADADRLSGMSRQASDGAYLLQLLAFEILLKALLRASGVAPLLNHSYRALFSALPSEVRDRVLARAVQRMAGNADYSKVLDLLDTFSRNFIALRYPYEAYEGVPRDELTSAEMAWVHSGAQESDAMFVYYPEELFGLTEALEGEIMAWLKIARP